MKNEDIKMNASQLREKAGEGAREGEMADMAVRLVKLASYHCVGTVSTALWPISNK